MPNRSSLLIGVSEYRDPSHNLDVVSGDIEELETVFSDADYAVDVPLREHEGRTSSADILHAVEAYANRVTAETVVIYLSGHGLTYSNTDYLVPGDASVNRSNPTRFLVSVNEIVAAFEETRRLKHIVVFFDACRSGIEPNTKSRQYVRQWEPDKIHELSNRQTVYIFGCKQGKESFHNGKYSYLSRVLADVFRERSASTLGEVKDALHAKLAQLDGGRQEIRLLTESGGTSDPLNDIILLPDASGRRSEPAEADPWSRAVQSSRLWPEANDDEEVEIIESFRAHAARIAEVSRTIWDRSVDSLPQDPWWDEDFPVRVASRIRTFSGGRHGAELNAAEVGLLLTAPFVREARIASATAAFSDVDPYNVRAKEQPSELRNRLEATHRAHDRFRRRAVALGESDREDEEHAIAAWLLHQRVRTLPDVWNARSNLWEVDGTETCLPFNVIEQMDQLDPEGLVSEAFTRDRIDALSRWVGGDVTRLEHSGDDVHHALNQSISISSIDDPHPISIRATVLAATLSLSGRLAIDVRTLSDVIVEHIGVARSVTPETVVSTAVQVSWYNETREFVLGGTCPHPAIDLALRDHADDANRLLDDVTRYVDNQRFGLGELHPLPRRFDARRLAAKKGDDGTPEYDTPHLRFHLDPNEVQQLLMGKQLYGDPELAIRELYQNALDACRYRKARTEYLERTSEAQYDWEGRITFKQGVDEDGRAYIECTDNGVGMGRRELEEAFAKAGSRYHDLPSFVEEQAEWQQLDPPIELYPNSQFGIGVFSYFMLADELEIETCRMKRDGTLAEPLRIDVTGSGSLFHVRPAAEPASESGTRIRLYLRQNLEEDLGKPVSCVETLRDLLWVAEFETVAVSGETSERWLPNALKVQRLPLQGRWSRSPGKTDLPIIPLQTSEEQWLVKVAPNEELDGKRFHATRDSTTLEPLSALLPQGRLLADGIVTDKTVPGRIVNLTLRHRPRLSVDRLKILGYDRSFVNSLMSTVAPAVLNSENWATMNWLWAFGAQYSEVANHLQRVLRERSPSLQINTGRSITPHTCDLNRVGCFPIDQLLWFKGEGVGYYLQGIPDSICAARIRTHLTESLSKNLGIRRFEHPSPVPAYLAHVLSRKYRDGSLIDIVNRVNGVRLAMAMHGLVFIPYERYFNDGEGIAAALLRCEESIGVDCTQIENLSVKRLSEIDFTLNDCEILSDHFGGKEPLSRKLNGFHIVTAAHRLDLSIDYIEERLQYLREPLGLDLSDINFDQLRDVVCNDSVEQLLSSTRVYTILHRRSICLGDLIQATKLDERPLESALEGVYTSLSTVSEPLGIDISRLEGKDVGLLYHELKGVAYDYLRRGVGMRGFPESLTGVHFLNAARKLGKDPVQLASDIRKIVLRGGYKNFDFKTDGLNEIHIPDRYLRFLSEGMEGDPPHLESLSTDRLVMMAWFFEEHVSEILKTLKPLEKYRFTLPELDEDGYA